MSSPSPENPLIPERYLDVPSQRLYYLSLGLLCQSIKILDLFRSFAGGEDHLAVCRKWLLVDFLYCFLLRQLRIPRLEYNKSSMLLQIGLLWFLDGILFGGVTVNFLALLGGGLLPRSAITDTSPAQNTFTTRAFLSIVTFGLISPLASISRDGHLLGQHTVRMSPISTAHLNPQGLNFCLSQPTDSVLIPIILNNTNFAGLKYSITPLGDFDLHIETREYSAKELRAAEQQYLDRFKEISPGNLASRTEDEYDEYDEDNDIPDTTSHSLQNTQSIVHIVLSTPGIVRLERVFDSSNADARLTVSDAVVVPCPRVEFVEDKGQAEQAFRCVGLESNLQLKINVRGVPPLSLRWLRTVNGVKEHFLVEGIEADHVKGKTDKVGDIASSSGVNIPATLSVAPPRDISVPLAVSLETQGTYVYALEEVTDGMGNVVRAGIDSPPPNSNSLMQTKTTRSYMVLQKPSVSFDHCSTESPMSLLIGSETNLAIKTMHADPFDGPWELTLSYQPPVDDETKSHKRYKARQISLKQSIEQKDLIYEISSPGDYKIVGIKGKYCTGTVLSPDVCRVVQKPFPSAEMEWQRIHECSGDTGVSATLVLHGTPPFEIYYKMQRDKEAPRELTRTFSSSRAELILQPDKSGHYVYSFAAISDANYKKVELQGPSIDQMVHPVASADFSDANTSGRGRKIISTCSRDVVEISVDLRGTPPWNLGTQVIGPSHAQNIDVQGIESPRKVIQIPIPKELQTSGGNFEIDLVSVEDASKCKRPISVPGVEVRVKRTMPTVQFYGETSNDRHIVIPDYEKASLPLRLTGDSPWRLKYKRIDSGSLLTTTLYDRNGKLQVADQGVYELVDFADSHCPGSIVAEASTYTVEWIPRPSAKLSPSTDAIYVEHNASHILPPICEAVNDHVDLELTGRPPFQITYNIAQSSEFGGTKILGQPTFNSIQSRTRFQLQTTNPGRMYYEVKQIGDAAYPLSKSKDMTTPSSEKLLFEQQIFIRPSAKFRNRNRLVYCLNDALVPTDPLSTDGTIILEGTPPFVLVLSIRNVATSEVDTQTIQLPTSAWKLDLPSYSFTSIGAYLISIEKVTDSSNCQQVALDALQRSIWVDVAETATIIPFERGEDICVGDVTQFQLEGIPPWTVGYKVNGRSHTQEVKTSPFSFHQQQPGLFAITSIAHQQKMCKASVTDLRFNVHAIPSAQVGNGEKILQDIHEGDQAEIIFTLIGEPSFTFTYQRSELGVGRVLETHTVSRIHAREYSIHSALEGTWTVTSISDRYCRYPSVQSDLAADKQK